MKKIFSCHLTIKSILINPTFILKNYYKFNNNKKDNYKKYL